VHIVVNCETRLCSQFLGPGDNFLQSYGAIFTDRAATGSGSLMDPMSTAVQLSVPEMNPLHHSNHVLTVVQCAVHAGATVYSRVNLFCGM
jgi:hypothetical protein